MAQSRALFSRNPDGSLTDQWIWEELLGDDVLPDDQYTHRVTTRTDLDADFESKHPRGQPDNAGQFVESAHVGRVAEVKQTQQAMHDTVVQMVPSHKGSPQKVVEDPVVRGLVKGTIHTDLTERLRDHPAFAGMSRLELDTYVQSKLDTWADTSGDSDLEAIRMQRAVQEQFELTDSPTDHLKPVVGMHADPRDRELAFVQVEYERTQAWFKAHGITHVTVFRGMNNKRAGLALGQTEGTMQPASSWSTDLETAASFALWQEEPVVIATRVPVSEVLSTAVTGRGALVEQEIVLLGRKRPMRVFNMDDPAKGARGVLRTIHDRVKGTMEKIQQTLK